MHEFKTAVAPNVLITEGLGPCIGVGIIHEAQGFLLHSPDVIMESDEIHSFFNLLHGQIPRISRAKIVPVVAGGSLEEYSGDASDEEIRESTRECRRETLRLLTKAGFGRPNIRWGEANQCNALILDLKKRVIILKVYDSRNTLVRSEEFLPTLRSTRKAFGRVNRR